jgi:hypothetical protein
MLYEEDINFHDKSHDKFSVHIIAISRSILKTSFQEVEAFFLSKQGAAAPIMWRKTTHASDSPSTPLIQ